MMNYYQHHIGDFDRATRHLTRIERSVYRDLLDVYYDTEKPLTTDIPALCRKIVARSSEESTAVEQVLNEFFLLTPIGWYHDRCEEELDVFRKSISQKSTAGKASAAARAEKRQRALNGNSTGVERALNGCSTDEQRHSNGTPTNQEPIANNHKPETNKAKDATPAALPDWLPADVWADWVDHRAAKKSKMTPKAAQLCIDDLAKAAGLGLTPREVIDHCIKNGWTGIYMPKPQARASPAYQTASDKRKSWCDELLGVTQNDQRSEYIDITPAARFLD